MASFFGKYADSPSARKREGCVLGFFHAETRFQKRAFSGSVWRVGQNDAQHVRFSQKSVFVWTDFECMKQTPALVFLWLNVSESLQPGSKLRRVEELKLQLIVPLVQVVSGTCDCSKKGKINLVFTDLAEGQRVFTSVLLIWINPSLSTCGADVKMVLISTSVSPPPFVYTPCLLNAGCLYQAWQRAKFG